MRISKGTFTLGLGLGNAWRAVRWWGLVAVAASVAQAARDDWRYVRTENFEMLSQASEKKTRKLVAELEQFRASFLATFRLRPAHEPRVTVMLFDSDRRFTPYKPTYQGQPKEVSGYFIGGDDETVIALNLDVELDEDSSPAETIFHEYVHLLLHTRGMKLPTWLNEGLAELFSTFQVDGSTVQYGRPKQLYVDVLNLSSLMPIGQLMAVTEQSKDYNEEERAGMFYAQAWALTHFLVCGEDRTNSAKLARFLATVETAPGGPEAAFREAFGTSFDKLEQQLRNYLQGGRYFQRRVPAPLKDLAAKIVIRPATEAERDLALINLRWRVHRSGETMLAALHYAENNPTSPRPQELLGAVEATDGNMTAALGRWRRAAELGSDSPFILAQAARARLLDLSGGFDPDDRLAEADAAQLRGWLDRAVKLSPAYDDAWELLALVESQAPEFRIAIINDLQARVMSLKDPNPTLLALAVIRWRAKDLATAGSILKAVTMSSRARPDTKAAAELFQAKMAGENGAKSFAVGAVSPAQPSGAAGVTRDDQLRIGGQLKIEESSVTGNQSPPPAMPTRGGKTGAGALPPVPPRVQPVRLATETAILGAEGEIVRSDGTRASGAWDDGQLVERVATAVAEVAARGGETQPAVIYRAPAHYPEAQRRAGVLGEARVRFTVQTNGHPGKVRAVNSTVPDFGAAAEASVQQWRFVPGIKDGKAVSTLVEFVLTFGVEPLTK